MENSIDKIKQIIRDDFAGDTENELIGFCKVENSAHSFMYVEGMKGCDTLELDLSPEDVLILWVDNHRTLRIDEIEEFYKNHIDV